ncbi:MAG: hypothetical protein HQK91_10615 [Nitrospirae bacterium]|nr:hypothetical protein [Nitrospirota bacterium]MBF0541886.1 hypothetical protein [Nitrospirota bacterium]
MAEPRLLVNDAAKYYGLYVAMPSFMNRNVVCLGKDPLKVHYQAIKEGYNDPVVLYVPEKDTVLIL